MTPRPTGGVRETAAGRDLVLTRSFRAPIDDVWASVTESERTAEWYASWTGDPGPGNTIRCRLEFEDGAPEVEMTIEACEPPQRLAVSSSDEYGSWHLEAHLAEHDGVTELTLVHHLGDQGGIGEIGPGWEYYLDMLVAARDGTTRPDFDDYYPAQRDHYEALG